MFCAIHCISRLDTCEILYANNAFQRAFGSCIGQKSYAVISEKKEFEQLYRDVKLSADDGCRVDISEYVEGSGKKYLVSTLIPWNGELARYDMIVSHGLDAVMAMERIGDGMEKNDVVVKCFGSLEIITAKGALTATDFASPQCCMMLVYLLCNRHRDVSIQELGEIFDRQDQADKLVKEFTKFYDDYKKKNEGKDHPKVMILMGLPGSYIIATPNSYVGSLVELAGGENVYSDTDQEFLTVNTEDMKTKEPDIILRAAHALPDQVVEMFNKDFAENDIWQHFDAVKNGRVYDLTYEYFGMSATFKYPQALEELQPILYPESDEDTQKAKEASDNAQKKAKDSDATEKYNEQQSK